MLPKFVEKKIFIIYSDAVLNFNEKLMQFNEKVYTEFKQVFI